MAPKPHSAVHDMSHIDVLYYVLRVDGKAWYGKSAFRNRSLKGLESLQCSWHRRRY